ncbi:4-hydroxy-3-methylbut-2-enyl diphosphate reductase [Allobranchiibius sp. GilTou73]|uniref:4-hydroxy-3-methylbut-2-enyl diphosphate reductase n=1 Tax=Allobranchiibius sp. GilTou73 TaxID=2904523 RepID=UPI001F165D15|nr:4-hydroxy-3-methylbut-2-enyl diphosphate reductase [Allobranchiibius sp. GilTou73]UIJ34778.1 4-hydroxy-3-methylbut-2-enyl diphosphate reductase [Allobranchiibius sp. GilTou73]
MTAGIATALRIERVALGARVGRPIHVAGRGPRVAPTSPDGPTLLAGVAGGLVPGVRAGHVVVADRVLLDGDGYDCPAAPLVAGALRRRGLTVHVGPIASVDHVVDGPDRAALAARTGALAVDTESGYLARQLGARPLTVVRAIVDGTEQPLRHPGTALRGVAALRALREAAPVLREWYDATLDRDVLLAGPRSFCAGVERAIEIVDRALQSHGAPVYVRRQIVHNAHVVHDLQRKGAIFVQEVEEIPRGAVTVLAAHGVAPSVRQQARERDLVVIDATCPLVAKVHTEVRRFAAPGSTVFLIGHADHEEVVGTRGEAPENVVVVDNPDEAARVQAPRPDRVSYVMQTTLAVEEAQESARVLRDRFPALRAPARDDICYATSNRQQAVRAVAADTELVLVVGSLNSSNSRRLVEVAEAAGTPAHLVEDATEVDLAWLRGARRVGITAGASAPPSLVDELVHALSGLGAVEAAESSVVDEHVQFTLPREVS